MEEGSQEQRNRRRCIQKTPKGIKKETKEMRVSEKQLLMLIDIAKDSLRISGLFGGYTPQIRLQMVNDIINQQSNELKEIEPVDFKKELNKRLKLRPDDDISKGKES